ncbi:hypothetical protein CAMGR0001_0735 [Campylobacter gracilis RM3268]|uniref:Uncharacterized protein n=1 Tax=Campylobacter gracilis RM3268 TaxID=553220 RepID=C8PFU3_9BACT|nr:hypothetical protein CAMGR0001_0735 [Campylobacter gracilis RM3268]
MLHLLSAPQLRLIRRCFKFTAAKRVKFHNLGAVINFIDRVCAMSL